MAPRFLACAAAAALFMPAAASAQVGPALDPGLTVGYAGGEAVHYDNKRRSGDLDSRTSTSRARSAHICKQLPQFRAKFGKDDNRVVRLTRLCRQIGH